MITLKLTHYSDTEKAVLLSILREASKVFPCAEGGCKACEFRHVCNDIGYAAAYVEKQIATE